MEKDTYHRKRRDSSDSAASAASETGRANRSRSTTPFTLRSHCRHGSECPEGHGLDFHSRMSQSPKRSTKKSPRRPASRNENINSVRKNLIQNLETSYATNRANGNLETPSKSAGFTKTSDYSSGEDDMQKENSRPPTTPIQVSQPKTPLQRSAEKTDYTYARSHSYRSVVTPERIIYMPNMTRRSVEATRSGGSTNVQTTLGERYASPELRTFHRTTLSYSLAKQKGAVSYGTDFESDNEGENESSRYELRPPADRQGTLATMSYYSRVAYAKVRDLAFALSWRIYLITCYSLLLDTLALQSRGVTALRNVAKQHRRTLLLLLTLSALIPLVILAGGSLYSALHALSLSLLDKFDSPASNPATTAAPASPDPDPALVPILNSVPNEKEANPSMSAESMRKLPAYSESTQLRVDDLDRAQMLLREELKLAHGTISALHDKIGSFHQTMSAMTTDMGSFKDQIVAVSLTQKDCCDQSSPEAVNKVVDAKWSSLVHQMFNQAGLGDAAGLAALVQLVKSAQTELDAIHKWKLQLEAKEKAIEEQLTGLQSRIVAGEEETRTHINADIARGIADWASQAKPLWFQELKEQLSLHLMKQVEEKIDAAVAAAAAAKSPSSDTKPSPSITDSRILEEVKRIIRSELATYDSDKTGMADYALEPAGGVVLSTRCTEAFNSHRPRLSIWGFPLWSEPNNPRVVIQPGIVPGQCWSFRGFDGYLVIQLSRTIRPTAFTLEHIPRALAPDGKIDSAPKEFSVYGLHKEMDIDGGILLGKYTYDEFGSPLQMFAVQKENVVAFPIVELRIHSNFGHRNYTCLYRFRVHGQVVDN